MVTGLLTTSYPRFPGDYAGAFVADRVAEMRRNGAHVEIVCAGEAAWAPSSAPANAGDVIRVACAPGVFYGAGAGAPENLLDRRAPSVLLAAAAFSLRFAATVARRARAWDAVESHFLLPCGLTAATLAPRLPHVAYAHSGDVALLERLPGPLARAVAERLARSRAELRFVSGDLQRRFVALLGREAGRVVRLTPDAALFHPPAPGEREQARAERGFAPAHRVVLGVGRLVPVKGFATLVRALSGLGRPDVALVILGEGPERDALAELARSSGVALRLVGAAARPEVAAWMRSADVFVQPSVPLSSGRTEGMPYAVLEALASGLQVVASRTGGLAELAGEVDLVPPGDVLALTAALARALR